MTPEQAAIPGVVYLVGAGPGDPGLITVRGRDCLARADVVVYDYLATPVFEVLAPKTAEAIYVGKTRGCHHLPQEEINALLEERARAGQTVVRLKGGDPYIFGRGGEEAHHLFCAGIPFEVVPGVTAGFAAATYAGIPLTHRDVTTTLGLVTGHEHPDKKMSALQWDKLATGVGTLVFYMGVANLPLIAEQLMTHGRPPQTPVAIVRWATTPRQQVLVATLEDVVERAAAVGMGPPAVIIVGEVVKLRPELRWFDNRPLFGRRFLVTRRREDAGRLVELLAHEGAEAVCHPTIELAPPEDWAPLDGCLGELPQYDYLVLTSANAVAFFFDRLTALGADLRALAGCEVIAVGPKTAAALRDRGLNPDAMPEDSRAEGIVAVLKERPLKGCRVLYPRAELARDLIPQELRAAGARVDDPVLYRTLKPEGGEEALRALLRSGDLDGLTFTSSSTVDNFCDLVGEDAAELVQGMPVIAIGPLTSATVRKRGLRVAVEAETSTLEAMVLATRRYYHDKPPRGARQGDADVLS